MVDDSVETSDVRAPCEMKRSARLAFATLAANATADDAVAALTCSVRH